MIPDISSLPPRIEATVVKGFRLVGLGLEPVIGKPKLVVMLADGSEDACVVSLLLHRFNGRTIVGLLRPVDLGMDNVGLNLSRYMHVSFKQNMYFIVIDQDTVNMKTLWKRIEASFIKYGTSHSRVKGGTRWKLYECSWGGRNFRVSIAVNGINHRYVKHSIEDHLIELAIVETLVPKLPKVMNSKEEWRRLCKTYDRLRGRESLRAEVYKRILTSQNTLRVFSQHLEAIKALLEQSHLSKEI